MKICKTCKIEKNYSKFRKSKRHKDGFNSECKDCLSIKRREYYINNIDRHKETSKKYYEENKKEIYEKIDKERKKKNDSKYREKNKEKLKKQKKDYYEKNKEKIKEKSMKYYSENKEKINQTSDTKREIRRRSYKKRKYQYVWREILRKTIYQLKNEKNQTTLELLGYSYYDSKENLESKFQEGMCWENHGEWHVDHIIPISLFKDGTDPSIVNDLNNLRPLWSKENLSKQDKIDDVKEEYSHLFKKYENYLVL